jgi:hypothetical protein
MGERGHTDPHIQVHAYDEHTCILRQNMAVNHEAPFMFLLFGNSRALLLDTGATASPEYFPLRATYYDRYSRILFTGDTVYPGRLYVFDWAAFVALHRPARRLVRAAAGEPRARLPHRDEHDTRPGLPGGVDLPARRTSAAANRRPSQPAPGRDQGARSPARSVRTARHDHHACVLTGQGR